MNVTFDGRTHAQLVVRQERHRGKQLGNRQGLSGSLGFPQRLAVGHSVRLSGTKLGQSVLTEFGGTVRWSVPDTVPV